MSEGWRERVEVGTVGRKKSESGGEVRQGMMELLLKPERQKRRGKVRKGLVKPLAKTNVKERWREEVHGLIKIIP